MAFNFSLNPFAKRSADNAAAKQSGSSGTKKKLLGILATVFFILTAASAYLSYREDGRISLYVGQSSQLMMLSQHLANDVQQALYGKASAFDAMFENKVMMRKISNRLDKGDSTLPATTGEARIALNEYMKSANKTLADAETVEVGRDGLVALGVTVSTVDTVGEDLRVVANKLMAELVGPQKEQATRFALAVERIGKDVGGLLAMEVAVDQVASLAADALAAEEQLVLLPDANADVISAQSLYGSYRNSIEILISQVKNLVAAKSAANSIVNESGLLLEKSQRLVAAYESAVTAKTANIATLVFGLLLLMSLMYLIKAYLDEARLRGEEAARINNQNQNAILRLMNELGDLADGDLTVRATVSEDITGAIADSLNYTTEEFRKLVARITAAVEQMGGATKDAESISQGLLDAAQLQAKEIKGAGEAVQLMTQSIKEVDFSASQSADVARRTLAATEQGAQAVRNTISGMDVLREQIQDTSKRIKRLGESSQEIGEIVDLISDITEQTNVLALNAAIQAASAGEAGRGFSVVAEEVQRLAERSGEATKQIGGLVKTIQGDTHDAVAAMEKSTLGVVEGAKLSDMAGQSLREIEQVSNELAALITSISTSTQVQSDMASEVASVMQDILKITVQTTEGTRLTANSIAQLASLTVDLRGSVADFKL